MTALKPETVESLLRDLIAVLDEASRGSTSVRPSKARLAAIAAEEREAAAARARARQAARRAAAVRRQMLPVAVHLARAAALGDRAGTDAILHRPRTLDEWRDLALILASAADPSRIGAAEATAGARERPAYREAS